MKILTIKDKNYNVVSMKDIFEILNSNGMNEVSRYIKRYLGQIAENSIIAMEDSSKIAVAIKYMKDGSFMPTMSELNNEVIDILKEFIISIDEVIS